MPQSQRAAAASHPPPRGGRAAAAMVTDNINRALQVLEDSLGERSNDKLWQLCYQGVIVLTGGRLGIW